MSGKKPLEPTLAFAINLAAKLVDFTNRDSVLPCRDRRKGRSCAQRVPPPANFYEPPSKHYCFSCAAHWHAVAAVELMREVQTQIKVSEAEAEA